MTTSEILWEIFVNYIESSLDAILLVGLLTPIRTISKRSLFLGISLIECILITLCNFTNVASNVTQLAACILSTFICLFLFRENISKKIFTAVLPSCISILADQFTFSLAYYLFPSNISSLILNGSHRMYATVTYLIVYFVFVLLFIVLFRADLSLPPALSAVLYGLIILGIYCTNEILDIMLSFDQLSISSGLKRRFHLLTTCFLIVFFSLIILIRLIGYIHRKNEKLQQQFHDEQINRTRLDLAAQSLQSLRTWRHDYKNHLITLTSYARKKKYADLLQYLTVLQEQLPEQFDLITTGNEVVDAILTSKAATIHQHHISFDHSILWSACCLSDPEITSLLGNLLDNAIEACTKPTASDARDPFIHLTIKPVRSMLSIYIENSSDGIYNINTEQQLETTKPDAPAHGNGLSQIQRIVQKRNGFIEILPKDHFFAIRIMIPMA